MTRRMAFAAVPLVVWAAGACSPVLNPNCPDSGADEYTGFAVAVRPVDRDGRPAVIGTTVTLAAPDTVLSETGRAWSEPVFLLGRDPGTYTVEVRRPWWTPVAMARVRVANESGNAHCPSITAVRLDVILDLAAGAPPVRQVVPDRATLGISSDPPFTGGGRGGVASVSAVVEADEGVAEGVVWSSADPGIAAVTADGHVTVRCRVTPAETELVVRAVADPSVFAVVPVTVRRTSLWACPPGT